MVLFEDGAIDQDELDGRPFDPAAANDGDVEYLAGEGNELGHGVLSLERVVFATLVGRAS